MYGKNYDRLKKKLENLVYNYINNYNNDLKIKCIEIIVINKCVKKILYLFVHS